MSMLAERRKKQRISVDPQNKQWQNDTSKFGQKMLEKMGWKTGSGLGAKEQGISDPIKLKVNSDTRGLGCERKTDDCWIEQQKDFAQILEQLNKRKDDFSSSKSKQPDIATTSSNDSKSLQAISKRSKARIHYHKFAKGKDLSSYTCDDVSSILGKRKRRKCSSCSETNEFDNTNVSTKSVNDYFTDKMKRKLERK